MRKVLLDTGWTVESLGRPPTGVRLPHDAMIHEPRDPHCRNGENTGYFPGGRYTYRKRLHVPQAWRTGRVSLLFEGAYHRSEVSLNGVDVGGRPSGYAEFHVDLDDALADNGDNDLVVVVDNSEEPNSRWYTGSGLYRPVWLEVESPLRVARDGVRFRTTSITSAAARCAVDVLTEGAGSQSLDVQVSLRAGGEVVTASEKACAAGEAVTLELEVVNPRTWCAEAPYLHDLVVTLLERGVPVDERRQRVGLRTVSVDARHGLRISGVTTKLRGGCLHHDHGVLGAATFPAAELRRARILKQVGFNAVRAGHAPMSRAFLDACDEVGLYVLDELTDVWFVPKTKHDASREFTQWWRADLASLVAKDRNHPSVIMYSVGNENSETSGPKGIDAGRQLAERCHELDPTRPVTTGVNLMLNALARIGVGVFDPDKAEKAEAKARSSAEKESNTGAVGSAFINQVMMRVGTVMGASGRLRFVDRASTGIFDVMDVAGHNYGEGAYKVAPRRHPSRVVLGTETMPTALARNWRRMQEMPHVIGDFMWSAQDYLGEAGLGAWGSGDAKRFPAQLFGGGAVDLTGWPGPIALHARAVWGLHDQPAIVVRPPDRAARRVVRSPWRTTDAVESWSWPGHEGKRTQVLVFSASDQVELLIDGRHLATRPAGRRHGWTATFDVEYQPGSLTALARDARGRGVGRATLNTVGPDVALRLSCDRTALVADGQDLAFVSVALADSAGVVLPRSGVALTANVDGPAELAGFGSADPAPLDRYDDGVSHTYFGRALAVIRSGTRAGEVRLTVTADGYEACSTRIGQSAVSRPI